MGIAVIGANEVARMLQKLFNREADVLCDPVKQDRRDIPALVKWHAGPPSIRMPKLLVGTALTEFRKPHSFQNCDYFSWFKDRDFPHSYPTVTV